MHVEDARRWVVPIPVSVPVTFRLFCFPPAGSGTIVFRPWAPLLAHGIQLCPLLPPGREARLGESPISTFEEMVSAATTAISHFSSDRFALFGHSLGSLVAYEVARRLTSQKRQPLHLFVSGHQAPGLGSRRAPIAHLPEPEFLQGLASLGGTPPEIMASRELLALMLPMLRADFALAERYFPLPGPRLTCPVTALGGQADPWIDAPGLAAWRAVTTGWFESELLEGDHFYIGPSRETIVAHINSRIAADAAA